MNCKECHNNLEAYIEGQLPAENGLNISKHLEECKACAKTYALLVVANKVIAEEKAIQVNPYLSTRVMAGIEKMEAQTAPKYATLLRPIFITTLIVAAVLLGIFAGNLYKPASIQNTIPQELVYINDAKMESLSLMVNE